MSLQLIFILVVLMIANQIIGTGYGSWKSGFNKDLFWKGFKKIVLLFVGYGAIALAARFTADYIPKAEYLSGTLLEPIATYFTKACDFLKQLLNEPTKTEFLTGPQEPANPDVIQEKPPAE